VPPFVQVQEELQAGLMQSPRYIERLPETPPAERAAWKLAFRTPPQLPIFTGSKIEDEAGNPLEVILVDADTGSPAALPQAALRVEVVPVFGDFPPDGREDWSADEFQRNVVKEREGKRPLLTGDVSLTMRDGRATVGELQFTDNSSWVRCRKFRIAVRAVPSTVCDGARIQEAMTEAFMVRDHRGELYRKHYPPVLADDVWRLEKIGKEGAFHRKLRRNNVGTVQEFVRMLMVKPDELRAVSFLRFPLFIRTQSGLHFSSSSVLVLIDWLLCSCGGSDSGRRHDRPHVGGDDQPRQDLRLRRQGVRAHNTTRHHLRGLHLQHREGRPRRRRPVATAGAAAEQGPDGESCRPPSQNRRAELHGFCLS
jgi:hypothetical protein